MSAPAVSVLLPVRNAAPHLEGCLQSLYRQTLADFEVVAVDDGSSDGSAEILQREAARDPRLRVIRRPPGGLVAALEAGRAVCGAPMIARMDADDVSHPERLERQARLLDTRPKVGVVSCLVRHYPRSGVGEGFRIYEDWLNSLVTHRQMFVERFVESPLAHPSTMVRTRLLADIGGYRDRGWPEDYDLWLRLFHAGVEFAKIDRPLFFWRDHPYRLSRRDPRYSTDAFLRCKAHHLLRGPLAGVPQIVIWGAGQTGRRLARYLMDGGASIDAFIDIDPLKIGRTARGKPIVAAEDLPEVRDSKTTVLAAVASRGARQLIRDRLTGFGLQEGRQFWCVA
jgi:glycosyltransferase involved in cell wall biosynthesis